MSPDVRNPSFPRAIPHGMLIIDSLTKGVLFGVFPGCLRAVSSREGFQSPSGVIFGGCLRTSGKHFSGSGLQPERKQMKPKLGLDHLEPKLGNSDSHETSDPDSNLRNRTPRQFEVSSPNSASGDFNGPKLDLGLQA